MKKFISKYHVLHHQKTLRILVKMRYLKVIEVPSLLINHRNVRYVDEKSRYMSTSKLMALLYSFPQSSLTVLDSPKIEKEVKLCYKCFKSRINNVPLKSSLSNCYLIFAYLMGGISLGKCDKILVT